MMANYSPRLDQPRTQVFYEPFNYLGDTRIFMDRQCCAVLLDLREEVGREFFRLEIHRVDFH